MNYPPTITILAEDLENAASYTSNSHCLIATAMRRLGFEVNVGSEGKFGPVGQLETHKVEDFNVAVALVPYSYRNYKPSLIGRTFNIIKL